jgi:cyclopropane fatty-acyl-phospholipid synthase-like methyltransferase
MAKTEVQNIVHEIGAKPSLSEESGLELIGLDDLAIFSPGISTGGIAEIRMALDHPDRKVIATTVDQKGYEYALNNINELELSDQILVRLEDLTKEFPYDAKSFDFIYARLVLHYLSYQDLNITLTNFRKSLKPGGKLFVVVRSVKNIEGRNLPYDPETRFTTEPYGVRYFHSTQSISEHLTQTGFEVVNLKEYEEQLYTDFMRTKLAPAPDHLIEILAS